MGVVEGVVRVGPGVGVGCVLSVVRAASNSGVYCSLAVLNTIGRLSVKPVPVGVP